MLYPRKARNCGKELLEIIDGTKDLLGKYDLRRGWFGAETLLKSVTCTAGHPLGSDRKGDE